MSNSKNIKQIYADALYWAMSPQSKDKPYHITRTEESVLRKLIHYDRSDARISYSNELIAQHTFLDVTTIEKAIPALNKKGYITTITFQINDGTGRITSRRLININWELIQAILNDVPSSSADIESVEPAEVSNSEIGNANGANGFLLSDNAPKEEPIEPNYLESVFETGDDDDESEITMGDKPTMKRLSTKIVEGYQIKKTGELLIDSDLINFSPSVRENIMERIKKGLVPKYKPASISIEDEVYQGDVLIITDRNNPRKQFMTKKYIETGVPV